MTFSGLYTYSIFRLVSPFRNDKKSVLFITALSIFCFRELYDEHSTYSSKDFLMKLIKAFPFPIREVQTDNGTEWTTALLVKDKTSKTLFEKALENMDIIYHRIRAATPRHLEFLGVSA